MYKKVKNKLSEFKQNGLNNEDFERTKKLIYGGFIKQYNDVTEIAKMFLSDFMKNINSFEYLEEIDTVDLNFTNQVLKNVFKDDKMVLSVVKS